MFQKTCPICNRDFITRKRNQIYCSKQCQFETMRKPKQTGICLYCGKSFVAKRFDAPGKYCSHQCQINDLHDQKMQKVEKQQNEKQKRKEERQRIQTEKNLQKQLLIKQKHYKPCLECGRIFYANNLHTGFCSDVCKKKHNNRHHDKRLNRCKVKDNSIDIKKLYKKYNGICQMCGKKLTFKCDCNDDLHPSIDHIVPIARGGNHTWDNVQLLCRRCNRMKSDKII